MSNTNSEPAWMRVTQTFESPEEILDWLGEMLAHTNPDGLAVTWVQTPDPSDASETLCVAFLGNGPNAQSNGALIAGAPALLFAAKCARDLLLCEHNDRELHGEDCAWCDAVDLLRAAVAKAEGGAG